MARGEGLSPGGTSGLVLRAAVAVVALALSVAGALGAFAPAPVYAQDPIGRITSPQQGAVVRDVVAITGTATHPKFSFYKVEFAPEPTANWSVIGDTFPNQVQEGVLVQWNTAAVPDGSYSLRLLVVDETGNYLEHIVRQVVVANAGPEPSPSPSESVTPTETTTPTVTPTAGTPEPTATVGVVIPALETPTITATRTTIAVTAATPAQGSAVIADPDESSSTGDAIKRVIGGLLGEVLGAIGIDFAGLGSATLRGAAFAAAVFGAVGALALVRATVIGLYRLIRR